MIVTIDGPAGAGKSTVAHRLAERLGFDFLDTGAMYRCVTLAALQNQLDWNKPETLAELAGQIDIRLEGRRAWLNGVEVTHEIRTNTISNLTHHAAGNPAVRQCLVELQRKIGRARDLVTEGRDQGTVVFPDAQCKIFLSATPEERARRRHRELLDKGEQVTLEEVLDEQTRRDERDARRSVAPMQAAPDAIEVLTDGLTQEQVVEKLVQLVRDRHPGGPPP